MADRADKLQKIVALAKAAERRSGEQTGQSQAKLNDYVDKLGELNAYRHNYAHAKRGGGELHSVHWKDYQNFLQRLDTAVRTQQQAVRDCEESVELHRRQWMAKRQRLESLERVMERYQEEDRVQAERVEQRAVDDLYSMSKAYKAEED